MYYYLYDNGDCYGNRLSYYISLIILLIFADQSINLFFVFKRQQQQQQQQQLQQQPKLDLATAHFPPLPTSGSENPMSLSSTTTPSSSTHSHMTSNEDGPKTLSDIVKGGSRPTVSTLPQQQPAVVSVVSPVNGGLHAAIASRVVERTIASATAKLATSQQPLASDLSNTISTATPTTTCTTTTSATTGTVEPCSAKSGLPQASALASSEGKTITTAEGGEEADKGTPRLSSVVSGGTVSHTSHQNSSGGSGKTTSTNNQQRPQRNDYRVSYTRQNGKCPYFCYSALCILP